MIHYLNYNGERWRVATTGLSHDTAGLRSAGAHFTHEATGRRVDGSLNPADVERPTDGRLTEALESALEALRSEVPTVFRHAEDGTTGFEIVHAMYTVIEENPELAGRPGYSFSTSHLVLDEATTRRDLTKFFGLSDAQVDAALRDALPVS